MNFGRKVAAFAAVLALLAVPMSALAAQQSTKRASAKAVSRVYLLETPGPNTSAAENFQNRFRIDY